MTSDKKRDYNPVSSTIFPHFPSGHRPLFPKPKAKSPEPVFPLHFVQNVFFPPGTPKNHDFSHRQHPDFVQNVQSPLTSKEKLSCKRKICHIKFHPFRFLQRQGRFSEIHHWVHPPTIVPASPQCTGNHISITTAFSTFLL